MTTFPKNNLAQRLSGLGARLRHAFAIEPEGRPLSLDDVALLERVADAVIARGMVTPATLFLESMGPMNFLGSQALHFLTPMLEVVFPARDLERVAHLLERRDTLSRLVTIIETRSEAKRATTSS
ncbi:MAG TPA: hypothetical protein VJ692_10625 [Nitrospiraceae bacterium]|nr:hypothetical protein [Nitrospiraceae bacterium]